jgi:hypothetical protein
MRHGLGLGLLGAIIATIAIPACGGSSEGGGSAAPIPQDQLAARTAAAVCDNIGSCCQKNGWAYDAAACKQAYQTFIQAILVDPAMKGGVTYDAQAAGTCVSAISSIAANCGDGALPDACERIYVGTKPEGAACEHDLECAAPPGGDADCSTNELDEQVCVQEPRGKPGDGCSGTCTQEGNITFCSGGGTGGTSGGPARCFTNDGLYCGDDGKCQALIAVGGACQYDGCVSGAFCLDGMCAAKLGAGADCSFNSWEACGDGLYCEDTSSTCAAKKPDGAACGSYDECLGECDSASGKCVPGDFVSPELCSDTFSP